MGSYLEFDLFHMRHLSFHMNYLMMFSVFIASLMLSSEKTEMFNSPHMHELSVVLPLGLSLFTCERRLFRQRDKETFSCLLSICG